MKKQELIKAIAAQCGLSQDAAAKALNATLDIIVDCVKKGEDVGITGFGTFKRTHRKARTGVNPQTGDKIQIKASNSPSFKSGKTFKDAVV